MNDPDRRTGRTTRQLETAIALLRNHQHVTYVVPRHNMEGYVMKIFFKHIRARDVRRHQVGRELNAFEAHIQDPGQSADHQRLGQPRHALQQAMPAGEDGREESARSPRPAR